MAHVGMVRQHNEDRLCVIPPFENGSDSSLEIKESSKGILLAVADGMGGTNAGEVAAEIAIQTVMNSYSQLGQRLSTTSEVERALVRIILEAHRAIKESLNEDNIGMGTTLVLAFLSGTKVHVAWCGDSRVYRYSRETIDRVQKFDLPHLQLLTHDHSIVWQMVKEGKLDPNEARTHEYSNIITQSLGDPKNKPKPESATHSIAPGDKILVCSDGLNSMLPDEFIEELLGHKDPLDAIGNSLIEAANAEGGLDNISIILAEILSVPETAAEGPKPGESRPEAITKRSDLTNPVADKSSDVVKWVMNETILLIIIIVVILILGWYGIKWFSGNNNEDSKPNTSTDSQSSGQLETIKTIPAYDSTHIKDTLNVKGNSIENK